MAGNQPTQAFTIPPPALRIAHIFPLQSQSFIPHLKSVATAKEEDFRVNTEIPQTSSLVPHSFSGQVENAIIEKFGAEETSRVLESWRLTEQEYEHREFVGNENDDPETSYNYQHAPSYVRGLHCQNFWELDDFSWSKKLAKGYKTIRKEFSSVMGDMDKLKSEGNNVWAGALTDEASGYGKGWKTLVLMDRGMWDETNCNQFPKTAKLVKDSGIPTTEVFFASMQPHSDIKMHSDFTNFVLTSHLALDIPDNGNNKCILKIGDESRQWINGEVMLFDTSIMHNAANKSDSVRYILMFRLWHPDLTPIERQSLQLIYDCLVLPELMSTDPMLKAEAEARISELRQFPNLKGNEINSGFGGGGGVSSKKPRSKKKKKGKR